MEEQQEGFMRLLRRQLVSGLRAAPLAFLFVPPIDAQSQLSLPGCNQREYVYFGSRLLAAVDAPPDNVTVGFDGLEGIVTEGGTISIPIRLQAPGQLACRVSYEYLVEPLTAGAGTDYTPPPTPWRGAFSVGTPSEIVQYLQIATIEDAVYEAPETFQVRLTSVSGGIVGTPLPFVVTIQENDAPPTIRVTDATVAEGNSGTTQAAFVVSACPAVGPCNPAAVDVSVSYQTADGTATAPSDYQSVTGTVTFSAALGETQKQVAVNVVGDTQYEANEAFALNLSNPVNATIGDGLGVGTILNDDLPGLALNEVHAAEGDLRATTTHVFTVTLEAPVASGVTVQWATSACTASTSDFVSGSGTVSFPPNDNTPQTFSVLVNGDTTVEGHELYQVTLSSPANAALKDPFGHGTIDNDDMPALAATGPSSDFNLDGDPDLLWSDQVTGSLTTWQMRGANRLSAAPPSPPASANLNWTVVGTPDLGGTTQPDILWRNVTSGSLVVWLMNGLSRDSGVFLSPSQEPDLNWMPVGTGEFGTSPAAEVVGIDILWRNTSTGALRVWIMSGISRADVVNVAGAAPPSLDWDVAGTGDFDGDGFADIWWRNHLTGQLMIWRMAPDAVVAEVVTPSPSVLADLNWRLMATADLDRDRDADLVWRHAVTGNLVVWLMNGATRACGVYMNPSQSPDINWSVVGPR